MALSAVVLPAPFGPISPKIRPSGSSSSKPSSATVVPNDLRNPRASMHAMASPLFLFCLRRLAFRAAVEHVFRFQSEALDGSGYFGPALVEKVPAFPLQQRGARARIHKHAEA